jgi:hypothetical protein
MVMRRRHFVFAVTAVTLATLVPLCALVATDVYLHGKFQKSAGYNVWGYRGPTAPKKQPGEYRVVMLGGSAAYGYGANWDEAIPAVLEHDLAQQAPQHPIRVLNLGYNNEGAYSFIFTLRDYLWLDYDLALLYEGYNDLIGDPRGPNVQVFRHESPVYRLTGYLPIFQIVFKEKAAMMLTGDSSSLYLGGNRTVFHPGVAARSAAGALTIAADVGQSLERQLERVTEAPSRKITDVASTGCQYPWQEYCRSTLVAVEFALQHGKQVLVIAQPHPLQSLRDRHIAQQTELSGMLHRRFGTDSRVQYVDLGDTVDLSDPERSFDRMHLTAAGNAIVAAALVEPVKAMAAQVRR